MFGGQWSSASGDIKYLICHVISQNHVIEGLSNFLSWSSSWYVTTLPCLVAIGVRDIFLVCHMIKQDHVIKVAGEYNDRSPLREITTLPSLVVIGTVVLEI